MRPLLPAVLWPSDLGYHRFPLSVQAGRGLAVLPSPRRLPTLPKPPAASVRPLRRSGCCRYRPPPLPFPGTSAPSRPAATGTVHPAIASTPSSLPARPKEASTVPKHRRAPPGNRRRWPALYPLPVPGHGRYPGRGGWPPDRQAVRIHPVPIAPDLRLLSQRRSLRIRPAAVRRPSAPLHPDFLPPAPSAVVRRANAGLRPPGASPLHREAAETAPLRRTGGTPRGLHRSSRDFPHSASDGCSAARGRDRPGCGNCPANG